jgi:hypothetical protein
MPEGVQVEQPHSTNLDQHIAIVSRESPRGLVLDWWSRLESTEAEFARSLGLSSVRRSEEYEDLVRQDIRLGPVVARRIRTLRRRRNRLAHGVDQIDAADAERFAREAWHTIGLFARLLA